MLTSSNSESRLAENLAAVAVAAARRVARDATCDVHGREEDGERGEEEKRGAKNE